MAEYVEIAGNRTWFDEVGVPDGEPMLLLHGALSDSSAFFATTPAFVDRFRVLLMDRRGQGHTPDVDGPITYELMAQDTIAFLDQTVGGPTHLVGHSDGANVSLLVARHRPDLVARLVLISGNFHHDGLIPDVLDMDEIVDLIGDGYAAISPDGREHLPVVAAKLGRMIAEEPTMTVDDLAEVAARTLVMVGDDDAIILEHTVALYRGIAGSELAVVPGTSHVLILEKPDLVNEIIVDFLTNDPVDTFVPIRRAQA